MLSAQELMKQSMMTAHDYMLHAKQDVDAAFGAGYAAQHPELVAAYMQAAALDFVAMFGLQGVSRAIDGVAAALDK